jgi:nucleoside-diphosphate-sugar epimerase
VLQDEKILITGPAGRIAFGLARSLAADNEVWGIARFGDPATRQRVEALGVTTRIADLGAGRFDDLPTDFTYLLHLAADFSADDYQQAIRVNAEGTGLLLEHCRNAKPALVMSTVTVYKPHPDPWHASTEDDPVGDQMQLLPIAYRAMLEQRAECSEAERSRAPTTTPVRASVYRPSSCTTPPPTMVYR